MLGDWEISLMFVMIGAVAVASLPFQIAIRHPKTLLGVSMLLPTNTQIDQKLIIGAVLFGIGWGIAGICPAPAITLIGLGYSQAWYFIAAMLVGMFIHRFWAER